MTRERELDLLLFLEGLSAQLKHAREVRKALVRALRSTQEFLEATHSCVAVLRPGQEAAEVILAIPERMDWDPRLLGRFIRNERPPLPRDLLLAPVRRRGRAWAVLALLNREQPFDRGAGRALWRIAAAVSAAIETIDRERMLEVRDRIDRKITEQLRPKDLFYQILDGLRSLTRYDHSSALLIRDEGDQALTLVAEQIAWTKGKSRRIGLRLPLTDEVRGIVGLAEVYGFEREGDKWREWIGRPAAPLARLLDYNAGDMGEALGPQEGETLGPPEEAIGPVEEEASGVHEGDTSRLREREASGLREGAMIVAPLAARDGIFGVLKIAARHPGTFGRYDAELVERFRSQAAIAIQNSQRTETLETRMLEAERKHAMAELARSVSHDVNNALGAVLPLVQQIQEDLRSGLVEPDVLSADLDQIQRSLQVCRRIFGGMLSFARGEARSSGHGLVRDALDNTMAILRVSMDRHGVSLSADVSSDLPPVAVGQSDLEQVFLNLLTNAREAMPGGGELSGRARCGPGIVEISIGDTGCGIPAENLPMVQEPFFSTKPHGNGLGLSICRSILWERGGRLVLDSTPGKGTRVTVIVPQAVGAREGSSARTGASEPADTRQGADAGRMPDSGQVSEAGQAAEP